MDTKYGYCRCGCNQRTTIPTSNDNRHGYIKGVPLRFIKGHSLRIIKRKWQKRGYKEISFNGKRIRLHRYLMEVKIGRNLKKNEHVHHINGDFTDNRIENLKIVTPQEHRHIHHPGNPKPLKKCYQCGELFIPKRKNGKLLSFSQYKIAKYCSIACGAQSRIRRKSIKCEVCERFFDVIPYNLTIRKKYFCSFECRKNSSHYGGRRKS